MCRAFFVGAAFNRGARYLNRSRSPAPTRNSHTKIDENRIARQSVSRQDSLVR
jgi:hypothetical protein